MCVDPAAASDTPQTQQFVRGITVPTQADMPLYRDSGYGYGTGHEWAYDAPKSFPFKPGSVEGTIDTAAAAPSVADRQLGDAALKQDAAANWLAIAALGHDPHRFAVMDDRGKSVTVAGAYGPRQDAGFYSAENAPTLAGTHESIHRGFKRLRDEGVSTPWNEEAATRYLMDRVYGGVEGTSGGSLDAKQIADARALYGQPIYGDALRQSLANAEKEAQRLIATKYSPYGRPR